MSGTTAGCAVSILMVGFNSRAHVPHALAAIGRAMRQYGYEIRFVDNGEDGTQNIVRTQFPQVEVLESRGNIGFAAANNYLARGASGEWLLLLNPDTQLQPDALDILLRIADASPDYAVLGGLALGPSGDPLPYSCLTFPTPAQLLLRLFAINVPEVPNRLEGPVQEVEAVSGGYLLVRRAVWEALGGMDERYFLYAEELDFCRRAWRSGYRVGHVAGSRVVHDVGSGDPYSLRRRLYSLRGIATYHRLQMRPPKRQLCLLIHWLHCLTRASAGLLSGLLRLPGAARLQSYRQVACKPWSWWGGYL